MVRFSSRSLDSRCQILDSSASGFTSIDPGHGFRDDDRVERSARKAGFTLIDPGRQLRDDNLFESESGRGFTLIELLVVIAVIAVLAVAVVLVLNPAQLLQQSRDSNRLSDLATIQTALNLYLVDAGVNGNVNLGAANTVYVSVPDASATSTAGDQCQGLGLPALPGAWQYHCAASSTFGMVNGAGWIPVNFSGISNGSPLGKLPIDPADATSSDFYYTYAFAGQKFELASVMESAKYQSLMAADGGSYDGLYQQGSQLDLTPPFRSQGLIGYWPLAEGTGTTAYDYSGSGYAAAWSGTQTSPSSTYYASGGKIGGVGGYFDGSTDYAANLTSTINYSATFSIVAWFKTSTSTGAIAGGHSHNFLRITGSKLQGDTDFSSASWPSYAVTGKTNISNGVWHLGAFVINGLNLFIYVDGVLDNSSTQPDTGFAGSAASFYIGQLGGASGQYFTGSMNDVRMYDYALSPAEIAAIYNAEK